MGIIGRLNMTPLLYDLIRSLKWGLTFYLNSSFGRNAEVERFAERDLGSGNECFLK